MLEKNTIQKVNFFLATLASRYMKQHQGDILIDQQGIIETLEQNGEIELYVAENHFDTERRFQYEPYNTVEQARQNAREKHWGEYNILIKVNDGKLIVSVEQGTNPKNFPMEQMYMVDEWENYDLINDYGKHVSNAK
jgi:transcription initiation factor IIF auxiliary subunit